MTPVALVELLGFEVVSVSGLDLFSAEELFDEGGGPGRRGASLVFLIYARNALPKDRELLP